MKILFLKRKLLIALLLFFFAPLQSMDFLKGLVGWYSPRPLTLAQKIAHALVSNNNSELEQILLHGLDINQLVMLNPMLDEISQEIIRLRGGLYFYPQLSNNPYNLLYTSAIMIGPYSPCIDWLLEHGSCPAHLIQDSLDIIGRELLSADGLAWIQAVIGGEKPFPYEGQVKRGPFLSRILLLATGQGKNDIVNYILSSDWRTEITNSMLEQALVCSSVPGHTQMINVLLNALFGRLVVGSITKTECVHALRLGLFWASMQGRVEAVKVLLEAAQHYNFAIGWEHISRKVSTLLENHQQLDDEMRKRLKAVLLLWSTYAEARKSLIQLRVLAFRIAYEGHGAVGHFLPLEIAEAIRSLI